MKCLFQFVLPASILCTSLVTFQSLSPAVAQTLLFQIAQRPKSNGQVETISGHIIYNAPPPSSNGTAPTGSGNIGRGDCPDMPLPLTALVPPIPVVGQQGLFHTEGQTVSAHPTIWFYVPYKLEQDIPVNFELLNEANNPVYQTAISLPTSPGIISVQVPSNLEPLAVNKLYQWRLQVKCSNPAIEVSGWIQRVEPSTALVQAIKVASPQQKAQVYAENGIWYDTVTVLAKELQRNPNNTATKEEWAELLKQVGLQTVVSASFTE